MPPSPGRISLRRLLGMAATLAFALMAIPSTAAALRDRGHFAQWQAARPVNAAVDLSTPGVYTFPFQQTCQTAHGEMLLLEVDGGPVSDPGLLTGLKGTATLLFGSDVIETSDLADAVYVEKGPGEGRFQLAYMRPFGNGTYSLTIQVVDPAPALASHRQTVFASYFLCGMEAWPEYIEQAVAISLWAVTLLIGLPTALALLRHGIRTRPAPVRNAS